MLRCNLLITLVFTVILGSCNSVTGSEEPPHTPCENGLSETFPCKNIGLYAHIDTSELSGDYLNDIWGWIDPETEKEYAIVGLNNGVDIIEITNPAEPVIIGQVPEPEPELSKTVPFQHHDDGGFKKNSPWRDMKVHKNTLYIVSEQNDYGLQIFDLTQLRDINNPPVVFNDFQRYTHFGNAHNLFINNDSEYLYVVGSTSGSVCAERGGLHIVDISEPFQPEFAGCYFDENAGGFTRNGYIHDTQCVKYEGPDENYQGKEVCFSSAEFSFLITDVSDKKNAQTISLEKFEGHRYMHQGWLTDDQRYFFMNDELDERNYHHNTRTYVWNVEDLEHPEMIGYYQHNTPSTDHNLYIKDDFMYQANYTAGLRILDISDRNPQNITEVAYFDTTPNNDDSGFQGLWSVYPWLTRDKIIVSDVNNGLFILKFDP